jgi:hypothetical protein
MQDFNKFLTQKNSNEEDLRLKQEREMRDANTKRLQLDLIVNRHIGELNKFTKDYEDKMIDFICNFRDNFLKTIEQSYQEFFENIDTNLLIYNSDNKLIQLKLKKNEGKNMLSSQDLNSDNKSVRSAKSEKRDNGIFFNFKITLGIFVRNKLHLYFIGVKDLIENDLKITFKNYHQHMHSSLPIGSKINENESDFTLNDIFKSSDNFGELVYAMVNFFSFDPVELKVNHLLDYLNQKESKLQNELFFESFGKFFTKIENQCSKGLLPYEFDIFITKHTAVQSFDILINIFLRNNEFSEQEVSTGKNKFNYI